MKTVRENSSPTRVEPFSNRDLHLWSMQLHTMLSAGVPLLVALESLARSELPRVAPTCSLLAALLTQGSSLSKACSRLKTAFQPFVVHLLSIGESSGKLVTVLERISLRAARREKMEQTIMKALAYPAFLSLVSLGMAFFMAFHMLPKLLPFLIGLEIELPKATVALIWGTELLAPFLLVVTVVAVSSGRLLLTGSAPWLQRLREWWVYEVPLFGSVNRSRVYAEMLRDLQLLTEAGCPLVQSLKSLSVPWPRLHARLQSCVRYIAEDGMSLSEAIEASDLFPRGFLLPIASGEEIGNLPHIFQCLADELERETAWRVTRAVAVIEPTIFLLMGLVVGFIVLATFLPFYSLATVAV